MAQGVLPFQYEQEVRQEGITARAGLGIFLDLFQACGLRELTGRVLPARGDQGFTDFQVLSSLVLLNLAGGECVDDLDVLEGDAGLCRLFRQAEVHGVGRKGRREVSGRFRRGRERTFPSASALFRWLFSFHDPGQEHRREPGRSFVPLANARLRGLSRLNAKLIAFAQANSVESQATLDLDATLIETNKREAFYCYKGFPAYQPLNVYWSEQELLLHTEFRDGNVGAGFDNLRVLKEALSFLPSGVRRVRFRADSASYQHELLGYLDDGLDPRFGRIEFAVSADVSPELKAAAGQVPAEEWRPLPPGETGAAATEREWAEVCFVPHGISHKKRGREYRYLAIREPVRQPVLPGMENQIALPFPTMTFDGETYKVRALVTNMEGDGAALIRWSNQRCGKSEHAHAALKNDLAGGRLPSENFGENAAWWMVTVMAFNFFVMMKRLGLGAAWAAKKLKAVRFLLINLPARVVSGARRLKVRLCRGHPSLDALIRARARILALEP